MIVLKQNVLYTPLSHVYLLCGQFLYHYLTLAEDMLCIVYLDLLFISTCSTSFSDTLNILCQVCEVFTSFFKIKYVLCFCKNIIFCIQMGILYFLWYMILVLNYARIFKKTKKKHQK